jgi:glycosyltransferase involved in cell wall biosynthesis
VKLIVQIPCLNERDSLPQTLADLPRSIEGIDEIEVLIIDDGSTDGTSERARELGVHHIIRFPKNRGLAAAFTAGIDAGIRLGADVIVNTDADNQYRGQDIGALVQPILQGRADLVIGDRQTDRIQHFSPLKKALQRWGSGVVRTLSNTEVADSPSGFRAISRRAALRLFVHNRFTYTLETVIQAGRAGLTIANVKIETNRQLRESRLFRSIPDYLKRAGSVMFRAYAMYRPVQIFSRLAIVLFLVGGVAWGRFLFIYVSQGSASGHVQSLLLGTGAIVLAFLVALVAILAELLAANRRLLEEVLMRVRRLDGDLAQRGGKGEIEGILSTGAAPWRRLSAAPVPTPAVELGAGKPS